MPVNNYITLDDPSSSGATTLALGINGAGQIVGSYTQSDFTEHGFLYR